MHFASGLIFCIGFFFGFHGAVGNDADNYRYNDKLKSCTAVAVQLLDCRKTYLTQGYGGKERVKGNRQGSLSRSITRRSGQNCKT